MSLFRRLLGNERGSPLTEFAIICPVLLMVLMGLGDLAYQGYMEDVLVGAVQKAGRDSTLQTGPLQLTAIDTKVKTAIRQIVQLSDDKFVATRLSYTNYAQIGPEPFTDTNGNGKRDKGECYSDINGNGQWDPDPGSTGPGGAGDVTLYTMQVTYPRLFPLGELAGLGDSVTIKASTILKNQPYANQVVNTVATLCN